MRRLNCPLRVKIKTKPQKGETLKQIILETPDADTALHKLEKILSEGEKRAVALADFLTEIALDETSRGIVLDDPVTSLDWEWKETVANCLRRRSQKAASDSFHARFTLSFATQKIRRRSSSGNRFALDQKKKARTNPDLFISTTARLPSAKCAIQNRRPHSGSRRETRRIRSKPSIFCSRVSAV